jgi:LysR family glycine cleavage system transcriptional activator
MSPHIPPLNALRAFEAAARLGSFKAAAAEASVTHGAISRHIRVLEDWLGAPLFARHNRRVVLTDIGDAYHAEISPAFERIAAATATCRGQRKREHLRVNALSTFTVRWLLPRLGGFRRGEPGFDVRVTTSNEAVDMVAEPCDVIIRGGPDTIHGFVTYAFLPEARLPVASPKLLAGLPIAVPQDLQRHTLLHAATMPRLWNRWLAAAGAAGLEPAGNLVLDHFYLTVEAALGGLGVAMGPLTLVQPDLEAGRLIAPFPQLSLPARSYCAYVPLDAASEPRVTAFCAWLTEQGGTG